MRFGFLLAGCIVMMVCLGCGPRDQFNGHWTGSMEMYGKTVDLTIRVDGQKGTLSSHDLMLLNGPISDLNFDGQALHFIYTVYDAQLDFSGRLDQGQLKGVATIQGEGAPAAMSASFTLLKESKNPWEKRYDIEEKMVESVGATLSAHLYVPRTKTPRPALVLLHGSMPDNPKYGFAFYADFFANLGFEVLIFDKRGSGDSTGCPVTATYEDLAQDAISCLEVLKHRPSADQKRIGLWGLSQGAMLLPFIASKTDIPSFLIAISPDVHGAAEAAAYADRLRVIRAGYGEKAGDIAAQGHRQVAQMIREGRDYLAVLAFIRDYAVKNPFMNQTGLYGDIVIDKDAFSGLYWAGRAHDFYSDWEVNDLKTLVVWGEADALVDPQNNRTLLENLHKNNIQIRLFQGANHVLKKEVNTGGKTEFDWPRIIPGYLSALQSWLEKEGISNRTGY